MSEHRESGEPIRFRPIAPADAPELIAGLDLLSVETRRARFFFPKSRFTAQELHDLTHCDGVTHCGWIAELDGVSGPRLICVARWLRPRASATVADVAFVTRDDWQHHGIGTSLLMRLADAARRQGITHFRAQVLRGNAAAERLLSHIGREVSRAPFGDTAEELVFELAPSPNQGG